MNHVANQNSPLPLYDGRSSTQAQFTGPPTFSPTKSQPRRPSFSNNQYHPPTPVQLPPPNSGHAASDLSPSISTPTPYQGSEYHSVPRDKPTGNYYDPTSDKSEIRSSSDSAWHNGHNPPPQVRLLTQGTSTIINSLTRAYHQNHREPFNWTQTAGESRNYRNGNYTSPANINFSGPQSPVTSHSHPPSRLGSITQSPRMATAVETPIMRQSNGVGPVPEQESTGSPSVCLLSCLCRRKGTEWDELRLERN